MPSVSWNILFVDMWLWIFVDSVNEEKINVKMC